MSGIKERLKWVEVDFNTIKSCTAFGDFKATYCRDTEEYCLLFHSNVSPDDAEELYRGSDMTQMSFLAQEHFDFLRYSNEEGSVIAINL